MEDSEARDISVHIKITKITQCRLLATMCFFHMRMLRLFNELK